ncbi:MAG: hypothetical protein ACI8S6_000596 [Myxococcota bacterium]|jgi:hypothetical protein
MKVIRIWLVAVLLLLLPTLSHAQQANFTGRWVIDEQLSLSMDPVFAIQGISWAVRQAAKSFDTEANITQSADRITVTFDNFRGTHNQVLIFDGQPHQTVNPAGLATTFSTRWDGEALVASGPVDVDGQAATLTERRSLSPRGDVMTVEVQLVLADGQTARTRRVYRKQ